MYFKGRADNQVKIRGYRIQLEEVEDAFVRAGATVCKAFVASSGELIAAVTSPPIELTEAVAEILPPYMRPRRVVEVSAIPLTKNGKVDFRALEALLNDDQDGISTLGTAYSPELESILKAIMKVAPKACLKLGLNLFECGVDSIGIWRILQELNLQYRTSFTLLDIIDDPTVDALEELLMRPRSMK